LQCNHESDNTAAQFNEIQYNTAEALAVLALRFITGGGLNEATGLSWSAAAAATFVVGQ